MFYAPPRHLQDGSKLRFPVVYLLHGGRPGSESKLLNIAPFIQEAHKSKTIPPPIYVFVNGGAVSHYDYPTPLKGPGPEVGTKGNSTFISSYCSPGNPFASASPTKK